MKRTQTASAPAALSIAVSLQQRVRTISGLLSNLAALGDPHGQATGGSNVVVVTGTPYSWPRLDVAGRRVQSHVRKLYREYFGLLHSVIKDELTDAGEGSVLSGGNTINSFIERRDTAHSTASAALAQVQSALSRQLEALDCVHSDFEGLLIVPDTNALYWNPQLEAWRAPNAEPFVIVLTPHVLAELDRHKVERRDTRRKTKAARLIRQIGDYRRRANQQGTSIVDGVSLMGGVSRILAVTVDPGFDELPKGLSGANIDQWFFASAVAVMRMNPRAPTAIVTRDVNLQNTIECARLTVWSPDLLVEEASNDR